MKHNKLKHMVEYADEKKKVNVLDLSSDQDLTIGLMNLLFIEDYISDKNSELFHLVSDVRANLMNKIVKKSDKNRLLSEQLLLQSMQLIEDGNSKLKSGDMQNAYRIFDNAYEMYSIFWGINMGLIDATDIK